MTLATHTTHLFLCHTHPLMKIGLVFITLVAAQGLRHTNNVQPEPVKVTVLTEALCPYCEKFIVDQLFPTFEALGKTAMDLNVIPFGNARINEEHETVDCQHGAGECDANTYELCATALTNNHVEDYLPFLVCSASTLPAGFAAGPFDPRLFQACAIQASLWWGALQACHDTPSLAWQVNQKAAKDTPDHPYVPYVLLNGEPMADGVDFKTEVCRLYEEQGVVYPPCHQNVVTNPFSVSSACPHDDPIDES